MNEWRVLITFLLQVGGSLGLWLGLGALQILQHIITITGPLIEKVKLRFCVTGKHEWVTT